MKDRKYLFEGGTKNVVHSGFSTPVLILVLLN